jgi:hypothetical protein
MQRLSSVRTFVAIHELFWRNLSNKLLFFGDEMNLRCLLAAIVISLAKWETLVSHKHAGRLCEGIEVGCIIIRWHLLLHVLLGIILHDLTLRMLANSATRLAPRVRNTRILLSWREHLLLLLLLFPIVRCSSLGLFIRHLLKY